MRVLRTEKPATRQSYFDRQLVPKGCQVNAQAAVSTRFQDTLCDLRACS